MKATKPVLLLALTGVFLTGCSAVADAVKYGADGAHVIATTEKLIDAAQTGDTIGLACGGVGADFGDPQDWENISAGKPQQFHPVEQPDGAKVDTDWTISLEYTDLDPSDFYPGSVLYWETGDGLCVIQFYLPRQLTPPVEG